MRCIYNKGKYRNGEYAKHLRPFLKTSGNRKWRRTAQQEVRYELDELSNFFPVKTKRISRRLKKKIVLKTKEYFHKDIIFTYTRKYRTLRGAFDSLKRNKVVEGRIVEKLK